MEAREDKQSSSSTETSWLNNSGHVFYSRLGTRYLWKLSRRVCFSYTDFSFLTWSTSEKDNVQTGIRTNGYQQQHVSFTYFVVNFTSRNFSPNDLLININYIRLIYIYFNFTRRDFLRINLLTSNVSEFMQVIPFLVFNFAVVHRIRFVLLLNFNFISGG